MASVMRSIFLSRKPLVSQKSPAQQNFSTPLAGVIRGSVGSVNALTHQPLSALTRRIQRQLRKQSNFMTSRNTTLATLLATALFSVSAAFAQVPAAPAAAAAPRAAAVNAPATPAVALGTSIKDAPTAKAEKKASTKSSKPFTAKTAKSKACSVKADEQKLHGAARKKFREECKKAA